VKILVTGGRDFTHQHMVDVVLDRLHKMMPVTCVVHGGARGADYLCDAWAKRNSVTVKEYSVTKEDYERFGKAAPLIRNSKMLDNENPDLVIVFQGNNGTADMLGKAVRDNRYVLDLMNNRLIKPLNRTMDFMPYLRSLKKERDGKDDA
jgi:hypothetical protein